MMHVVHKNLRKKQQRRKKRRHGSRNSNDP
jgi:hypothetical protein